MIILIHGASHTGKTALAQKLLEIYRYSYLSIDHLKMGLIRSRYTNLTPQDDQKLVTFLWPIVREIIKTTIENRQNLIIEGIYIPFDWQKDFETQYLKQIQYYCLVMSEHYIQTHFADIQTYANVIENRCEDSSFNIEDVLLENAYFHQQANKYKLPIILIDEKYALDSILHKIELNNLI